MGTDHLTGVLAPNSGCVCGCVGVGVGVCAEGAVAKRQWPECRTNGNCWTGGPPYQTLKLSLKTLVSVPRCYTPGGNVQWEKCGAVGSGQGILLFAATVPRAVGSGNLSAHCLTAGSVHHITAEGGGLWVGVCACMCICYSTISACLSREGLDDVCGGGGGGTRPQCVGGGGAQGLNVWGGGGAPHQFDNGLCLRLGLHQYGGQRTGYGVLQVCYVHSAACTSVPRVLSDWTLGAVAYPSKKFVMLVRRHTKVLANAEG